MIALGEFEQDALTEIFNIGVGLAANALSELTGEHVPVSVPMVALTSYAHARHHHAGRDRSVVAVRQTYTAMFATEAVLMFPQETSLALVRMMVGPELAHDQLKELSPDALSELGNIVLNAVMSALADALDLRLEGSLPTVSAGLAGTLFEDPEPNLIGSPEVPQVLALTIDFQLGAQRVPGDLVFSLNAASSSTLLARLTHYAAGPAA
jgi:chemotaxis protein CheC